MGKARRKDAKMEVRIEFDREDDGRWIAEAVDLPGVLVYGATRKEAQAMAQSLAQDVVSELVTKA